MFGADFLQLQPSAAAPRGLSTWLTDALRTAIADGRLPVGARLPATRGLAAELGVSRGVVVDADSRAELARHQRRARGRAERIRRIGGIKAHTTARQPVEVRCLDDFVAVSAHQKRDHLIGHDQ